MKKVKMNMNTTTNIECKPKATVKNLQFYDCVDKLIDRIQETEERGEEPEGKHRSSYDLVTLLYQYVDRYDWYDTVFEEQGKFGLKNIKGEVIVPARYDGFPEICHYIYSRSIPRVVKLGDKLGLVKSDGTGESLIPFEYDIISYMVILPYYTVKKGDKFGIVRKDGRVIVPCILDEVCQPSGNCVMFKADGKYGLVDSSCDDLYIAPEYDNVEFIDMEQPYMFTKDGVEGVINQKGEFIPDEKAIDYEGYLIGEYNPDI